MPDMPVTANATFCATLVDQWILDGLSHAFIAPGSRSTPLALALVERSEIETSIFHDERSASFAALGHGLATQRPAVVLCSSGTAGAHFFGAVIEADLAAVPLLVCTADRPPELQGRGAPQTIDQVNLYGTDRVRCFAAPGPPDDSDPSSWRTLARELWDRALGDASNAPGPVHANLSFRDPLTGRAGELPTEPAVDDDRSAVHGPGRGTGENSDRDTRAGVRRTDDTRHVAGELAGRRGVIIAGRGQSPPHTVLSLAERLGWPVIADHRSGCRAPSHRTVVRSYDALLRVDAFRRSHRPDVVLRVGEIVSSKAVSQWLSSLDAQVISTRPHGRLIDPEDIADLTVDEYDFVRLLDESLNDERSVAAPPAWLDSWTRHDGVATATIDHVVATADMPNDIAVAQAVVGAVPSAGALVVASSMPVRDVEWFGANRDDISVFANRGANGIDGTIATAIGVALTGVPTICHVGDVALLHDTSSLVGLAPRRIDLTIVVTDNDGGGIFSFLPQHDLLAPERYERLFGTPHNTDLIALARSHHLHAQRWPAPLRPDGISLVVAKTDRAANLALHNEVFAAVESAAAEI